MKNFKEIKMQEMQEINGGVISITILGITLVGAKAVAAITGGVVVVGGTAGLGFYLGYK